MGPLTEPQFVNPCAKTQDNSHQLSASAFPSIRPSLEMAGRKWSSLLHKGSHYLLLEVHVIANAHHMDGILAWAPPKSPHNHTHLPLGTLNLLHEEKEKKEVCYSASAKATWEETVGLGLGSGSWLMIFFWQASVPHICIYFLIYFCHVGAALLERRLVKKHWAEAADLRRWTAWLLSR